jgi:hypothetical protein
MPAEVRSAFRGRHQRVLVQRTLPETMVQEKPRVGGRGLALRHSATLPSDPRNVYRVQQDPRVRNGALDIGIHSREGYHQCQFSCSAPTVFEPATAAPLKRLLLPSIEYASKL